MARPSWSDSGSVALVSTAIVLALCMVWVVVFGLALTKDRAAESHEQDAIQWLAQPISLEIRSLTIYDALNHICKTYPCDLRINPSGDIIIRPTPTEAPPHGR